MINDYETIIIGLNKTLNNDKDDIHGQIGVISYNYTGAKFHSIYKEGHKIELLQIKYLPGTGGGCNLISLGSD